MEYSTEELLIGALARLAGGARHIAVGAASPMAGAAALLSRALSGDATRVSVLGSRRNNLFTDGARELFDCAAQGRIDTFFLGGGEIDGEANVNLVGTGGYPRSRVRFPGTFGSAYLYFLIPRVILFREEHSRRVLVPRVEFVSAPGTSPDNVYRRGGPVALVTGRAVFSFDRARRRFRLDSVHPGDTAEAVAGATGFNFEQTGTVATTPPPTPEMLALIRGPVAARLAETYPEFAARVLGVGAPPAAATGGA